MKLTEWVKKPMTPEQIADACEETAAILEGGHWTKGSWIRQEPDDDGGWRTTWCVEGALAAVLGLDATKMSEGSPARDLLVECPVYNAVLATTRENGRYQQDLIHWNDTGATGEQDVLDVLHATAKRVRGVGPDQMEVTS